MGKFLDLAGLQRLTKNVRLRLEQKQDKITGLPGQILCIGEAGINAMTATAEGKIRLERRGGDLVIRSYASNANLLDNACWIQRAAVINQRGKSEYTTVGYTIDRWVFSEGGKMAVERNGLRMSPENSPHGRTNIYQPLETQLADDTVYTLSILYDSNQLSVRSGYKNMNSIAPIAGFGYARFYDIRERSIVEFVCNTANSETIIHAAKLEAGSEQTLAHQDAEGNWVLNDPPPDRTLELLKCQRYYQVFSSQEQRPVKAADFRSVMRVNPALGTITLDGTTYYTADANL